MRVGWQVQILLRLYTSLLPNLRQAALHTAPSWTGAHAAADPVPGTDSNHDALAATIRREAAAVLNVGRVFQSEGQHLACFSLCCYDSLTVMLTARVPFYVWPLGHRSLSSFDGGRICIEPEL